MTARAFPMPATVAIVALLALLAGCSRSPQEPANQSAGPQGAGSGQAAALAAVAPSPGPGGPLGWPAQEGITVTGIGRITGTPDTLRATLGVEVTRPQVQEALDAANVAVADVLEALAAAGVAEDDIQTTQFSVQPQYRYEENQPPIVTGYMVTNLVEAKIRDLDSVGAVLTAAVTAGGDAARVQGVSFALEDNADMLEEARAAAFADARQKAEQYAQLAGVDLGALLSVTEVSADLPQPVEAGAYADGAARDSVAPVPIRPGSQEIAVTVTTTWAL